MSVMCSGPVQGPGAERRVNNNAQSGHRSYVTDSQHSVSYERIRRPWAHGRGGVLTVLIMESGMRNGEIPDSYVLNHGNSPMVRLHQHHPFHCWTFRRARSDDTFLSGKPPNYKTG